MSIFSRLKLGDKKIQKEYSTVSKQVELLLKSYSLPEMSPNWKLYSSLREGWSVRNAIDDGYNVSSVVFACIEKRAKLMAAVPWVAKIKKADGTLEIAANSPLQQLIDNPNPDTSWYEMIYQMEQSLCISGDAFISEIKAGSKGLPVEMWMLPSEHIAIKAGTSRLIDYYEYKEGGTKKIMAEDMVHIKMPNPDSRYFGQPIIKAASRAIDTDVGGAEWQKSSLNNRGVSDYHIELPDGATSEQATEIRDIIASDRTGPANARKPTAGAFKINQMSQSAIEMDFVNSRRSVWTEIAAACGIPLAAIGFTEEVNLANADAMMRQVYNDTIIPQLELYKRQLNRSLSIEFGPEFVLDYDTSNLSFLQESYDKKIANAEKLFKMGVPFNTLDKSLGLNIGEIDGGEVGYVSSGNIPTDLVGGIDDTDADVKRMMDGAFKNGS